MPSILLGIGSEAAMIAFVGSWAVAVLLVVRWIHIVAKNRVWSENAFIESVGAEPRLFIVD